MLRAVAALALILMLGGCVAGLLAGGTAIGAIGGGLAIANTAASLVGNVLTDSAKLACAMQAVANARGDAEFSRQVGFFCKW